MERARHSEHARLQATRITNRGGRSPFVLLCDHASNFIPAEYGTLGLAAADLERHIAWDPGAHPVASRMAAALDAVLVESCISRLIADCNRPLDAHDLIPAVSETTVVPGNQGISAAERERRVALAHAPFHKAIDGVVSERLAAGREAWLVSVHSFTPIYKGASRPWHIGVIHDNDDRLAASMLAALQSRPGIVAAANEPYSPADRVYYTLERHARSRNLPCAMIEIRNDEISGEAGQRKWADILTSIFSDLEPGDEAGTSRPATMRKSVHSAS